MQKTILPPLTGEVAKTKFLTEGCASIDKGTRGSAGRKCPHTASKPLRIHKVFSAAFSLSASISAPAELLRIGQPWIFEGFLFFWTQAGFRPPRRKGQKAPKGLAVRRMGFLPVDGLFSPTYTPPEKMVKTLFAPAGANSARLFDKLGSPDRGVVGAAD